MTRLLLLALLLVAPSTARATITLFEKDAWRFSVSGFIEMDALIDTTRGFSDVVGNAPTPRPDITAGMTGRTQFSLRNTRLVFNVDAPNVRGWQSNGHLELDFLGYNPDSSSLSNEATFFTSPTLRARSLYFQTRNDEWELLVGQTWSVFGWQPYYFSPGGDVMPLAGTVYSRNAQVRASHDSHPFDASKLEIAAAVARPPQRDAQVPAFDGGMRLSLGTRKSGAGSGAAGPRTAEPLSLALSGTVREFVLPRTGGQVGQVSYFPGGAVALDAFVPVIASTGDDVNDTLSFLAEGTIGRGYGDHFVNWTGNLSLNPGGGNLDQGIGGQDSQANFRLLEMRSFTMHFQFHFPEPTHMWASLGYGQLYSSNANLFVPGNNLKVYSRAEDYFASVFRDLASSVRVGIQYVYGTTFYADGAINHDHRVQVSGWFVF